MARHAVWVSVVLAVWVGGCTVDPPLRKVTEKIFPRPIGVRVVELESEDADVRREAVLAIAKSQKVKSVPTLVRLMCTVARRDPEPMVRAAAARTRDGAKLIPPIPAAAAAAGMAG